MSRLREISSEDLEEDEEFESDGSDHFWSDEDAEFETDGSDHFSSDEDMEFEADGSDHFSSDEDVEFEADGSDHFSSDENLDDVVFDDSVKPRFITGVEIPFSQLKGRMSPITDDGLILKEVLKEGVGLPIPEKSIVYIHYDAFLEGQKEAFDSTRLREKPFKFLFGDGRLLPVLEIGIQTMKRHEISRIMVSPRYALGEMGFSPRILPNAEILYEVQILKFIPGTDVVEFEEMSLEDLKIMLKSYQCDKQLPCDPYKKKNFKEFIAYSRHTVASIEKLPDDKRKGYLLRLYLSLGRCFLNLKNPKRVIIYADLALKIDPNNPKGLYQMGKALYLTGSYERAEHYLCKAKKHKPFQKCINEAIKKVEEKRKSHLD